MCVTINKDLLSILNKNMTYDDVIASSQKTGFGIIPFGEYLLSKAVLEYSEKNEISTKLCCDFLSKYNVPFEVEVISVPEFKLITPSPCGSCDDKKVR